MTGAAKYAYEYEQGKPAVWSPISLERVKKDYDNYADSGTAGQIQATSGDTISLNWAGGALLM